MMEEDDVPIGLGIIIEEYTQDLKEMTRLKLFKPFEISNIMKIRKQHRLKVYGIMPILGYFTDYIKFEKGLVKDVQNRRKKQRKLQGRNIEVRILKRIKEAFEYGIYKFYDCTLCVSYLEFCRQANFPYCMETIQKIVKSHPLNSDIWLHATNWIKNTNIRQAISFMYQGLLVIPTYRKLYIVVIQLELITTNQVGTPEEAKRRYKASRDNLNVYLEVMMKNINEYICLVEALAAMAEYPFTLPIQHRVIEMMMTDFCDEENVWKVLAKRERDGKHYPVPKEVPKTSIFRLIRSFEKYEQGISKICQSKKSVLWNIFLDDLIELSHYRDTEDFEVVKKVLIEKLNIVQGAGLLVQEKYYLIWASFIENDTEELSKVIKAGLAIMPLSLKLWKLKLRCTIKMDTLQIKKDFKKGISLLNEESVPLWKIYIDYNLKSSSNETIEEIYKDAIKQPKKICNTFKPEYLKWVEKTQGIIKARQVYREISVIQPFCQQLHERMAKLEKKQFIINLNELLCPLELACEQFGKEDSEVWINLRDCYYQFDFLFKPANPEFDLQTKISTIQKEAEEALKDNKFMLLDIEEKFDKVEEKVIKKYRSPNLVIKLVKMDNPQF